MADVTREVTLLQILQARENRALLQQKLLQDFCCPVISFTMNIAGPVKTSPLIERAFGTGLDFLEAQLSEIQILHREVQTRITGCQALYSVNADANSLKKKCIEIEEATPLGRLFDIDVIDTSGTLLHRDSSLADNPGKDTRGCIVCGAPGRVCAAGRLHSVTELQNATKAILFDYFADADSETIASAAVQSLFREVHITPKPGLVDRRNNGSHKDMTLSTFEASAKALHPYFKECMKLGQDTAARSPGDTFAALRSAGLAAEQTMLKATGGVNTHKGIIFTLGILCGALGRLWNPEHPIASTNDLLKECAHIAETALKSDFAAPSFAANPTGLPFQPQNSTAGLRLFHQYGITGIRGEAAAGFPSVAHIGLPAYENALKNGLSPNDAGVIALLHLIASVTDTNLYNRGGPEGAAFAVHSVQLLLDRTALPSIQEIEALDDAFIDRNLSPGGCADLLAVTIFLSQLRTV